ncbi:type VII secretion protein EssB [Leifsonia sp. NPDC077715]|uniref:type VII secretion protein EssB n=1 Tax=Leifsonia sp. NPDC077715 TaxID=3155539 RepID=UPI00343824F3
MLELEASASVVHVSVSKNGYDGASLDVIRRYVDAHETDDGLIIDYSLGEGEISFREAASRALTRLDRLALAQKLAACVGYRGRFRVPVIHPDNVYLDGDLVRVVHCGLHGMLEPSAFDEALFLRTLQAMVLQVFRPKMAFEQLLDGAKGLRDEFSTSVWQTTTTDELFAVIGAQLRAERAQTVATRASVSKRRYALYRILGALGVIAGLVAGVFAWQAEDRNRLQTAVVASQARFLASDYAGTLDALDGYAAPSLPVSAKYVLAVSSINLNDLTATQKEAILNNISEKSDDVTLNYWIALGRGELDHALDLAKNLGDAQLTLLAYTDLYQATKLNTRMAGAEKQKLLDEYAKAIDELATKLGAPSGEAAPVGEAAQG